MMVSSSIVRMRGVRIGLCLVSSFLCFQGCGGSSKFDGEKAPYGPRTPTTQMQSTLVISAGVLPAMSRTQDTTVVGQQVIAGVSYDRLATTRTDDPSKHGEYWIKENPDNTLDFAGFMHSSLVAGLLPAASTTFTSPIKIALDPPVGQPQAVTATGSVTLGGAAGPAVATFSGQYTLVEKDATATTSVGPLAGCNHYTGQASTDSQELPAAFRGLPIAADLWYHPSHGVVAFKSPTLGLATAMSGSYDCGSIDSSDRRIIRKVGVVDASTSFNLDTYECDGSAFAADKNTHASMLLEIRWVDEAAAKTELEPRPRVEFGVPMGYFPHAMVKSPKSIFNPEENSKGYTYWYAYVDQASKNSLGDSTAYHIRVNGAPGLAPIRVTARIYYKVLPAMVRPTGGLDGGLGGVGGGLGGVGGGLGGAGGGSVWDAPSAVGGTLADGGGDTAIGSGADVGAIVVPPGATSVVEEFDTLPTTSTTFVPIQAAGGDFAKFATAAGGRLAIDVPAGNSWGKTGVRSKEPVFEVTADMAQNPWTVLVELDPAATSGFVVALSPTVYDDIWSYENFWLSWVRHPLAGGTSAAITNTQNTTDTTKVLTNTPLQAPASVAVTARPGQIQACTPGGWGMEGNYAWMKVGAKVHAYVFAHPYDQNLPAKLAVKSIKVVRSAACGASGAIPAYTVAPEAAVFADDLAAGTGKNWTPIQAAGGDFPKFATTPAGSLFVNVPASSSWGKTGLRSNTYMFDVRADMLIAPLSLTFEFVPSRTSGFVIALSPSVADDIWSYENFWLSFVRHPTGAGAAVGIVNTQNPADSSKSLSNVPSTAPTTITLAVRPGHVQACSSTGWGLEGDYAWLKAGTKVHAYVFAHPFDQQMPVQMELTGVRADRAAGCGASGAIPAYPAPAPRVLFQDGFATGYATNWVGIQAAGGDFAKFAKVTTAEVYVDVPAENSWGKTGIRSNYFLFDVRPDYATAPMTVDFAFDPTRTSGFVVALSAAVADDVWTAQNAWIAFVTDPVTGLAQFDLVNTQNTTDTGVSLTGLPGTAPGKVSLTVTPKHLKATLSTGQVLEGDYSWLAVGTKVYAYAFSHPARQGLASRMALKSVTVTR